MLIHFDGINEAESIVQLGSSVTPTPVVVFFLIPSSCYLVIVHYSKILLNRENKNHVTALVFVSFFSKFNASRTRLISPKNFSRPFFPFFFFFWLNLNSSLAFVFFQNRLRIFLLSEIRQSITHTTVRF